MSHAEEGGGVIMVISKLFWLVSTFFFFFMILIKAVKGLVSSIDLDLDLVYVPIKVVWFLRSSKLAFGS